MLRVLPGAATDEEDEEEEEEAIQIVTVFPAVQVEEEAKA